MTRLLGPDMGSRAVFMPSGGPAGGRVGTVYADSAGLTVADILAYQPSDPGVPGPPVLRSQVTVDTYGLLPQWWFPDGVDRVWISVNGGPLLPVDADNNARIDAVAAIAAAALPTAGGNIAGRLGVGADPDANIRVTVAQDYDSGGLWTRNTAAGGNTNSAHIRADSVTPGSLFLAGRVPAEPASRFLAEIGGALRWGPGGSGTDTALYRAGAGHLHTEGQLSVNGGKVAPVAWLNVREFGAVGDGIADDHAAIQAAIDALPARGGTVYLPVGDYRITAAITARPDLIVRGDGADQTYIRQATTTADCIAGVDISYLALRDLQLYGPGSGSGVGLHLTRSASSNTAKISLADVVIYNFGSHGLSISNAIVTTLHNVSSIANGGHGFDIHGVDGGAAGTSVTFVGCYGNACRQAGYNLHKMTYCALLGCAADHNGIGYLIDTCEGVTLTGCGCETPENYSAAYPGIGFKVTGSTSVGLLNTWSHGNIGVSWLVTGGSTAVTLLAPRESEPAGTATAAVKVDAGSKALLLDPVVTTGNSLAAGTTSVLSNGSLALPGSVTLADDGVLSRPSPYALRAENNFQVGSTFAHQGANAGFYGAAPVTQPVVTGAKAGNTALTSLIQKLAAIGLISDSTT